jgi:ubiquinone biosynthesis protein
LQKPLLNMEGLGRQLYPQLDLWETAKPFLERWMREQIGPRALLRDLRQQWPQIVPLLPELPALAHGVLRRMHEENQAPGAYSDEIDSLRQEFRSSQRRFASILVGCILLLVAAILAVLAEPARPVELNLVSGLVGAGGVLLVVSGWFAG